MNDISDHPAFTRNTLEFITVCNDFCITLSSSDKSDPLLFTDYLLKVLPLLYIKAALLPMIEVRNPDLNERYVTQEQWESLFSSLKGVFGKNDEFWYLENGEKDEDPVAGSVAEHLTDIFQDLQDFLLLYQKNSIDAKENAMDAVLKSFYEFWGSRLINVHKYLHHLHKTENIDPGQDNLAWH